MRYFTNKVKTKVIRTVFRCFRFLKNMFGTTVEVFHSTLTTSQLDEWWGT